MCTRAVSRIDTLEKCKAASNLLDVKFPYHIRSLPFWMCLTTRLDNVPETIGGNKFGADANRGTPNYRSTVTKIVTVP